MQKIFITGGSGTVGQAFIERFYNDYDFVSYSRNEKMQVALKRRFPKVEIVLGAVEDEITLSQEIAKIKPDIVIHAAALKHVDSAEKSPISAVMSNVIGSLNLINACVRFEVPLTIGVSTDKACAPDSTYGQTKAFMEKMFLERHSSRGKFVVCRFGNVSFSHGSVIPYWLSRKSENKPLPLTDAKMNRLIIGRYEAAELIMDALQTARQQNDTFILSKKLKSVNMLRLANAISDDIVLVGLRPGEKLDERLVSTHELEYTHCVDDLILIKQQLNKGTNKLTEEYSSSNAQQMTDDEIQELLSDTGGLLQTPFGVSKLY